MRNNVLKLIVRCNFKKPDGYKEYCKVICWNVSDAIRYYEEIHPDWKLEEATLIDPVSVDLTTLNNSKVDGKEEEVKTYEGTTIPVTIVELKK